ncbi:MAG: hypothetical protein JO323_07125 [Acidobacteriia bacterium]|nr:hypothetical protein [Terriglobia bacterium]
MKTSPALSSKAILLLCSAAAWNILSGTASAEDTVRLTECVGLNCTDATTWTVPYVRQSLMITNAQLDSSVAANNPAKQLEKIFSEFTDSDSEAYAEAKARLAGILQYAASQSAEMGITTPVLYVSMVPTKAAQTAEGKTFIPVNKDIFRLAVLADIGAEDLKVSLSREIAHIRDGDTSAAAVVKHHNDPATSREAALRADLIGAGPIGAKNPIAATMTIEHDMRIELHGLVFVNGNTVADLDPNQLSDRDYKRISDEHTRIYNGDPHNVAAWDRIVALRKENRMMAEYEQTHTVRTHTDREAESKWLVDQILRHTR